MIDTKKIRKQCQGQFVDSRLFDALNEIDSLRAQLLGAQMLVKAESELTEKLTKKNGNLRAEIAAIKAVRADPIDGRKQS